MKCEEARQAWHRRLEDGRNDAGLDWHLAECTECARYARDMQRIAAALAELGAETKEVASLRQPLHKAPVPGLRRLLRIAAVIALLAGLAMTYRALWLRPELGVREPNLVADIDPKRRALGGEPESRERLGITLRGESARDLLAVAASSQDSEVQLYWLYPRLDGE